MKSRRNSATAVSFLTLKERRLIVQSWKHLGANRYEVGKAIMSTVFDREPAMRCMFPFESTAADARFCAHTKGIVTLFDAIVTDLSLDEMHYAQAVMDRSFRLGRRHAALMRGRTDRFQADWWQMFLAAMLEALLPHVTTWKAGAKTWLAWHALLTKVVENIILGFLTTLVSEKASTPLPTIFEWVCEDGAASNANFESWERFTRLDTPTVPVWKSTSLLLQSHNEIIERTLETPVVEVPIVANCRSLRFPAALKLFFSRKTKAFRRASLHPSPVGVKKQPQSPQQQQQQQQSHSFAPRSDPLPRKGVFVSDSLRSLEDWDEL